MARYRNVVNCRRTGGNLEFRGGGAAAPLAGGGKRLYHNDLPTDHDTRPCERIRALASCIQLVPAVGGKRQAGWQAEHTCGSTTAILVGGAVAAGFAMEWAQFNSLPAAQRAVDGLARVGLWWKREGRSSGRVTAQQTKQVTTDDNGGG